MMDIQDIANSSNKSGKVVSSSPAPRAKGSDNKGTYTPEQIKQAQEELGKTPTASISTGNNRGDTSYEEMTDEELVEAFSDNDGRKYSAFIHRNGTRHPVARRYLEAISNK